MAGALDDLAPSVATRTLTLELLVHAHAYVLLLNDLAFAIAALTRVDVIETVGPIASAVRTDGLLAETHLYFFAQVDLF